ncbi:MAG: UDP-glucose 4-epimerase GalE [Luteimonas sp.]
MTILVCGGAGYIGSHMTRWLRQRGMQTTVLDNLSTGHRASIGDCPLIEADLLDPDALDAAFSNRQVDAVMHFCARSLVGESVELPLAYYVNNVVGTLNLLQAMQRHGVGKLVFSSTAAVFGHPVSDRIDELHPKLPINPYGASKLMVERILQDAATAYGLRSVTLRYFNAAGASPDGTIGEAHTPETHLIPNAIRAARRDGPPLHIFGNDWPTPDGTCVRDYVHVDDLAQAHWLALDYLERHTGAHAFNLGNGHGFSVRDVVAAIESISGNRIPVEIAPRREGDPATLVASSDRARQELGWSPSYTQLTDIVETAWRWHSGPGFAPIAGR